MERFECSLEARDEWNPSIIPGTGVCACWIGWSRTCRITFCRLESSQTQYLCGNGRRYRTTTYTWKIDHSDGPLRRDDTVRLALRWRKSAILHISSNWQVNECMKQLEINHYYLLAGDNLDCIFQVSTMHIYCTRISFNPLGHTNLNICFSDPAGSHFAEFQKKKKKGCGQVLAIINTVYRQGTCA